MNSNDTEPPDDSTVAIGADDESPAAYLERAKNSPACLLAIGGDINGAVFDLADGETTIGRDNENKICLEFQGISRRHVALALRSTGPGAVAVTVADLGSRNGTFVNNNRLESPVELRKGDIINLGHVALKYIPPGDPERLTYAKLYQDANCDGLTGAFNKTYFVQASDLEVKKAKLKASRLALVVIDLDHFKSLNDTFGHDAGDYVLKEVARLIQGHGVRGGDTFARYGGEEFCILLPGIGGKTAMEIAGRLCILVAKHEFLYEGRQVSVTLSAGVAQYDADVENGTELFKRADKALYRSKHGGRNRVSGYDPSLDATAPSDQK